MKTSFKLVIILILAFSLIMIGGCSGNQTPADSEENREDPIEALIIMDNGAEIALELYPDLAPITVANFVDLARQGYYNGLTFHRIIPDFMIQGGCPLGTGMGGPDKRIKGEFAANDHKNDLKHQRGVISMARSVHYDSAGSQFFIVVADSPHLDGDYAGFGRVLSGMDEVDQIVNAERSGDRPVNPRHIQTITITD